MIVTGGVFTSGGGGAESHPHSETERVIKRNRDAEPKMEGEGESIGYRGSEVVSERG